VGTLSSVSGHLKDGLLQAEGLLHKAHVEQAFSPVGFRKPPGPRENAGVGRRTTWTLVLLAFLVPAGLYGKFYRGPGAYWVSNSFDGVLYEIFWCLLASLLLPKVTPVRIAGWVCGITCGLEFLQLWHPPILEILRSHFLGAAILGTTFDWTDFPYYFVGSAIGWLCLATLSRP
jgi:hypothetical protein